MIIEVNDKYLSIVYLLRDLWNILTQLNKMIQYLIS